MGSRFIFLAHSIINLELKRTRADFFSPGHWPLFVQFVRALQCPEEAHADDLPGGERLTVPSASAAPEGVRAVQTV